MTRRSALAVEAWSPARLSLGLDALAALLPMALLVGPGGRICAAGPTVQKVFAGAAPLVGDRLLDRFAVERPLKVTHISDFGRIWAQKLVLTVPDRADLTFRGQALPLADRAGFLVNLCFGLAVTKAVQDCDLKSSDFAPTDLAVDLLFLNEVKQVMMGELSAMNQRLQAARHEAEAQALTDPLTGLANRRALEGELARECGLAGRGGPGFAVLHVDLDFFKAVNDTLGHAAGDLVLTEVARTLREQTRKSDTVARVGGDEFVIILRGESDPAQVVRIGNRMIAELEHPILFEGQPCRISASIGAALSSHYALPDPERMNADADEVLYSAKHAGRGCCKVWSWGPPSGEAGGR